MFNTIDWQVSKVFFTHPTRPHRLLEISRSVNKSHTAVKRVLNNLIKNKIIVVEQEIFGTKSYPTYVANHEDSAFREQKKIANLQILYEIGLVDYLINKHGARTIILFGSYRKGLDTEDSDVDIYIETAINPQEAQKQLIEDAFFRKNIDKVIQTHLHNNLSEVSQELAENIVNGIVLYGFLHINDDYRNYAGHKQSNKSAKISKTFASTKK